MKTTLTYIVAMTLTMGGTTTTRPSDCSRVRLSSPEYTGCKGGGLCNLMNI